MAFISIKQAAENWQISEERVEELCREGKVAGAVLEGRSYFIPENAECPIQLPNFESRPSSPEFEDLIGRIDAMKEEVAERRRVGGEAIEELENEFLITYTYESDAIEGNSLTRAETAEVLAGKVIANKSLKEHLQCVGHRDAFERVRELVAKHVPLTEEVIKEIHSLILIDCPSERGQYRSESVRIMGAFHQPPEADRVSAKMAKQLGKFTTTELHAIENAVLFLMKFDGIHPFLDANGRTGRMILNFALMQQGYPAVSIAVEDRSRYYEAIDTFYRDNSAAPMVELIASYVEQRLKDYLNS